MSIKKLKPLFLPIACLFLLDQITKIVIHMFLYQYDITLIHGVIRFKPVLNTKLSWIAHFVPVLVNFWIILLINIIGIFILISAYLFHMQKANSGKTAAKVIMSFGLSGAVCSLIDKIAWGGSLDFIQIPNLFTFDLKDCYLSIMSILLIFFEVKYRKDFSIKEYLQFCTSCFKRKC